MTKQLSPFFLLAWSWEVLTLLPLTYASSSWTRGQTYHRCPLGQIYPFSASSGTFYPSLYACLAACSALPDCLSINLCFNQSSHTVSTPVTSNFFNTRISGIEECYTLQTSNLSNCMYVMKFHGNGTNTISTTPRAVTSTTQTTDVSTSALPCQNGGTALASGHGCACPLQLAGQYCERRPRDCTEVAETGATDANNGIFWIEPVDAGAFTVKCTFMGGTGITEVLDWCDTCSLDLPKMGLNDLKPGTIKTDGTYFIGLNNLYRILQQGIYRFGVHLKLEDGQTEHVAQAFYYDFTMQNDSEKYAISYANFSSPNGAGNGWPYTPAQFYSQQSIDKNCAFLIGADGWMASDCSSSAKLFNTPTLVWPSAGGGGPKTIVSFQFNVERVSPLGVKR